MSQRARFRSLRPDFMVAVVFAALVVTPAIGWLAENLVDERAARAEALAEADRSVQSEMLELGWTPLVGQPATRIAESHGIELLSARARFALPLEGGTVQGAPASAAQALAALVVSAELARYPREFLRASRLSRVLFCSALEQAETPIPSLPNFHRTLLLDVDADAAFLRRLVHHEVFHFIDYADDDQVGADPAWEKLNDRWFVYGSGGRFQRDPKSSARASLPGFVTGYAQSALEEDKAETFAFWMIDRPWLQARAKTDRVLAAKVAAIQAQIARAGLPPS